MSETDKHAEMRKNPMEYRKVFDTIPEQFDKFRPRYSADLFKYFIKEAGIGSETASCSIGRLRSISRQFSKTTPVPPHVFQTSPRTLVSIQM